MIKNDLPLLYEISFDKEHENWDTESKWQDSSFGLSLIRQYETELEKATKSLDLMMEKASAFVNDILSLKKKYPAKLDLLDFLQFYSSSLFLDFLTKNKYFPYCFDWINNSISDEVSTEKKRDFQPYRIEALINSTDPFVRNHFDLSFSLWTHDLFYYSRSTGGLNELTQEYIKIYFEYFIELTLKHKSSNSCIALCQIATWCHYHKINEQENVCFQTLLKIYNTSSDLELKKSITFMFSCIPNSITGHSRNEWCKIIERDYLTLLKSHEKFQLLINQYQYDLVAILANFGSILNKINEYANEDLKSSKNTYHRSRIFSILERIISTLVSNGQIEKANQIIGTYFSILPSKLIHPTNGYILPNIEFEILFCFDNNVLRRDADTKKDLLTITELENKFLGTTHTFYDYLDFKFESPKRSGVPDLNYANDYYNALSKHLQVNVLFHKPHLNECNGYFLLYGSQLSVQQVIAREIKITLPIIHSFLEPLPQRKLTKVFLWQGYTQMAELERIGLEGIFKTAGIDVVYCNCFYSSKSEFLTNYTDNTYDLFWVLGHGEFSHHESHKSYLDLGNEIQITIDDLHDIQLKSDERRLLFIDVCDGATTSLSNSPASIGIGTSLISEKQSLVSHAWPVENISSLILGILFCIFLSQGSTYCHAHNQTINLFTKGKEIVLKFIKQYCTAPDVIERIENNNFDYQNFYYWGSLVHII